MSRIKEIIAGCKGWEEQGYFYNYSMCMKFLEAMDVLVDAIEDKSATGRIAHDAMVAKNAVEEYIRENR